MRVSFCSGPHAFRVRCLLARLPVALVRGVGDWSDSGDVRLRERRVRLAGVFATEHAEEFGRSHPTPATSNRTKF